MFGRTTPTQPEQVACIRVAVVGNAGVGKTTLANFIAEGNVCRAPRSTAGCDVVVKLVEHDGDAGAHQHYFVELWDISGHPRCKDVRRLYYRQLNGIILVHDLSDKSSHAALTKWATELAAEGTFVAPWPDDQSSRNFGGLPVPVLIIGNKSDLARDGGAPPAPGSASNSGSATGSWGIAAKHLRKRSWGGKGGEGEQLLQATQGLRSCARVGDVDMPAVLAFFAELLARRYQPHSGVGWSVPRLPAVQQQQDVGANYSSQRLDDDWA